MQEDEARLEVGLSSLGLIGSSLACVGVVAAAGSESAAYEHYSKQYSNNSFHFFSS